MVANAGVVTVELTVKNMPDLVMALRREMAGVVRRYADEAQHSPETRETLYELADVFAGKANESPETRMLALLGELIERLGPERAEAAVQSILKKEGV